MGILTYENNNINKCIQKVSGIAVCDDDGLLVDQISLRDLKVPLQIYLLLPYTSSSFFPFSFPLLLPISFL